MTLQASGTITMADINVELGDVSNTTLELNGSKARGLAGISSGAIRLSDFYGKSNWRYSLSYPLYYWSNTTVYGAEFSYAGLMWNNTNVGGYLAWGATSGTVGSYTYFRGPYVQSQDDGEGTIVYYYRISRRVA